MSKYNLALKPKQELYIALLDDENIDLSWTYEDKATVERMWKAGADIIDIAKAVNHDKRSEMREPDEVLILVIDLARQNKLKGRERGLRGVGQR